MKIKKPLTFEQVKYGLRRDELLWLKDENSVRRVRRIDYQIPQFVFTFKTIGTKEEVKKHLTQYDKSWRLYRKKPEEEL